jgi:hypothetical protein
MAFTGLRPLKSKCYKLLCILNCTIVTESAHLLGFLISKSKIENGYSFLICPPKGPLLPPKFSKS